jgi:aldose 1-epimerase
MEHNLCRLENDFWQAGILPGTGASIAFGRARHSGQWVDVLRPTAEQDYGNSSNCASFIMLPWCNRIRGGKLHFNGQEYALETMPDDGTARHGDVRKRRWRVDEVTGTKRIRLSLNSATQEKVNWPFRFSAQVEYLVEGKEFVWRLSLKNEDERPMPAGFGHHPYFVRAPGVQVEIPCSTRFDLVDFMAVAPPVPLTPRLDFRLLHALGDEELNDLLTGRRGTAPARIVYPALNVELDLYSDALFRHILLFAPKGQPFFAVEPMTNASDGFNLYEQGIAESGVFVLQPGETQTGTVRLRVT